MSFVIDLCIVIVFAVAVFIGWKRGLVLSLFGMLSIVIAIFLGCLLNPIISGMIRSTNFPAKTEVKINTFISENVSEKFAEDVSVKTSEVIEKAELPDFIEDSLKNLIKDDDIEDSFDNVTHKISKGITSLLVSIISFIVVFILVIIGMFVLKLLLKGITSLPVIHQIDQIGGAAMGFISGFLIICILSLILCLFSANDSFASFISAVQSSAIGSIFYENNFLGIILSKLV